MPAAWHKAWALRAGDVTPDCRPPPRPRRRGGPAGGGALDGGGCPWVEDAPGGPQQLSRFGAMFTLLDGLVTDATLGYLQSSDSQPAGDPAPVVRHICSALSAGINAAAKPLTMHVQAGCGRPGERHGRPPSPAACPPCWRPCG